MKYRIEVAHPGYPDVWAECTIPRRAKILSVQQTMPPSDLDSNNAEAGKGLALIVRIRDIAGQRDYYLLNGRGPLLKKKFDEAVESTQSFNFQCDLQKTLFRESYPYGVLLTDQTFEDRVCELVVYNRFLLLDDAMLHTDVNVYLYSLNGDLYDYLYSSQIAGLVQSLPGYAPEVTNNIHGGYGVWGARSAVMETIRLYTQKP